MIFGTLVMVAAGVFIIFSRFWVFWVVIWGERAKNGLKWWKMLSDALISGTVHHYCHLWCTCVKWENIQGFFFFFFHFYKILIFRIFRGKREKMDQTDKKLCLSCLISQGPYIIWSSFMVHMCKMIISPGIFHFF